MKEEQQIDIIAAQIRELYARVVVVHKTQEKCADLLHQKNRRLKGWQIILSAITTTGILITVFGKNQVIGSCTAVISTIHFGLNTYFKNYNLGKLAQEHAQCATNIWNIREDYLTLLTDIQAKRVTVDAILNQRDDLQRRLFEAYKRMPRSSNEAYAEATKALANVESITFSEKEIDCFLPPALRMSTT